MATRKNQIIVLKVEYGAEPNDPLIGEPMPPAEWDWNDLTGEDVVVMAAGPLVTILKTKDKD